MIQLKGDGTTPASKGRFETPAQKGPYRRPRSVIARANLFIGLTSMNFLWGGILTAYLLAPAVVMLLRTLAKRCKRLSPLLAVPAALLLSQGEAKAILTYYIFENAGNVEVQAVGSLILPNSIGPGVCGIDPGGLIQSATATICTGVDSDYNRYKTQGPISGHLE